jgi:hypothetical protein
MNIFVAITAILAVVMFVLIMIALSVPISRWPK